MTAHNIWGLVAHIDCPAQRFSRSAPRPFARMRQEDDGLITPDQARRASEGGAVAQTKPLAPAKPMGLPVKAER
jgi:hypothetical protein